MSLTIEMPKDQEDALRAAFGSSLAQAVKEAIAIEGYRQAKLTIGEAQDLLGLSTRHEVEVLFAQRGVQLNYSLNELNQDRQTLSRLLGVPI
jgi:predicted HTH domain antitoxin